MSTTQPVSLESSSSPNDCWQTEKIGQRLEGVQFQVAGYSEIQHSSLWGLHLYIFTFKKTHLQHSVQYSDTLALVHSAECVRNAVQHISTQECSTSPHNTWMDPQHFAGGGAYTPAPPPPPPMQLVRCSWHTMSKLLETQHNEQVSIKHVSPSNPSFKHQLFVIAVRSSSLYPDLP